MGFSMEQCICMWPRIKACSELIVAARAKGDVVLGVHVNRQTGGALNSPVVTEKEKILVTTYINTYNGNSFTLFLDPENVGLDT